jgi:hypothetical protein
MVVANLIVRFEERNCRALPSPIAQLPVLNRKAFANLIDQLKEPKELNVKAAANLIVLNSSWKAVASLTARTKEPKELNARAAASPIVLGLRSMVVASLTARTKEPKERNVRAAANPIGPGLRFGSEPANLTDLECSASPFLAKKNQVGCYSRPDWSFAPNRLD